jgi:DNA mismatch endonuclease, patch repair protein
MRRDPRIYTVASPSFKGLRASSDASSRAMRANRSRNTGPEVLLRSALREHPVSYTIHDATLPGNPDVVFPTVKLAVFCDGDFWHGRHWRRLRRELSQRANPCYWIQKIASNRSRDRAICRQLRSIGWVVLRLWEGDIKEDPAAAAARVATAVRQMRRRTLGPRTAQRGRSTST